MSGGDPFYKGPAEPTPTRRLEEAPLSERPQHTDTSQQITQEDLAGLFDGYAHQINRATALIQAVLPRAQKLSIPVDVNATALRAAVRRRLQGSDGSSIPFDLYKDMVDFRIQSARKITYQISGELTGNVLGDANVIRKHMKSGGKGLSPWEDFILSMQPFLLWMMFTQLQGQFTCVEHREACAAKDPLGTETVPTQLRYAISIAAMMLILGLQEEHVLFAVQQPAGNLGIPPIDIINRARKMVKTDLHREMTEMLGANDHELIIAYCDEYIARNSDGYMDWLAYRDLLHTRERASVIYIHGHQYSQEYSTLLDYGYESKHTTPVARSGSVVLPGASPQYVSMGADGFGAFINELKGVDRTLSSIAGVLTSGFGEDLLCCLARFLGAEDVKRLKRIEHVLRVARAIATNGINIADPFSILDAALHQIEQQIMALIGRYFDQFGSDILGWIGKTSGGTWDTLFNCPLIEDLLANALSAVGSVRSRIYELAQQFMSKTFDFHHRIYTRWGSMYDLRRLDILLAILIGLIQEIERCATLGGPGDGTTPTPAPNPGENPTVWSGVPKPLILSPEVVHKFFSNPLPVRRDAGLRPIPPVGTIVTSSNTQASGRNFQEICKGILPDELIAAVARGGSGV